MKALNPLSAFRPQLFLSFLLKYVVHKSMEDSQPPPLEPPLSPITLIRSVQAELQDLETSLNERFPQVISPPSPDVSLLNSSVSSRRSLEDEPISLVRRKVK